MPLTTNICLELETKYNTWAENNYKSNEVGMKGYKEITLKISLKKLFNKLIFVI